MKVKLTNKEIINSFNKITQLSSEILPVKVSYAIAKNMRNINAEIAIYNKERSKIISKYCEKDSEGNNIIEDGKFKMSDDCLKKCNKELSELSDIEVEMEIHKFKLNELYRAKNMKLGDILSIEFMIDEK